MTSPPLSAIPLLNKIERLKRKNNGGFTGLCPSHQDNHASLSIDFNGDRVLLKCFSGCSYEDIMAVLFPQSRQTQYAGQHRPSLEKSVSQTTHKTVYPILDQDGVYVACHVREDGPDGKRYYWTVNGVDHTLGGIKTEELPLYRIESLRGVPRGQHVWLVEGEKATNALWEIGEFAVGTVTGASAIPSERSLQPLAPHFVTLWPDNDEQGRQHMERIAARLIHIGAQRPYMVSWAEAPEKGDAYDYLASGRDIADMAEAARAWESPHGERQRSLFQ